MAPRPTSSTSSYLPSFLSTMHTLRGEVIYENTANCWKSVGPFERGPVLLAHFILCRGKVQSDGSEPRPQGMAPDAILVKETGEAPCFMCQLSVKSLWRRKNDRRASATRIEKLRNSLSGRGARI